MSPEEREKKEQEWEIRRKELYEEYRDKIDSKYDKEDVGIYLLKNIVTNKIYIGQSKQLSKRKKKFLSFIGHYAGSRIDEARWSYPDEKYWEYTILEHCKPSELNGKEIYYIDKYKSYEDSIGYNRYIEDALEFQLQGTLSSIRYGNVYDPEERCKLKEIHDCQTEAIRERLEPFKMARGILYDEVAKSKLNDFDTFLRDLLSKIENLKSEGIDSHKWHELTSSIRTKIDEINQQYNSPIKNRKFTLDEVKEIIGDVH